MLTEFRGRNGRRLHPDDTLSMIRGLIDLRHPDLDADTVDTTNDECPDCGGTGLVGDNHGHHDGHVETVDCMSCSGPDGAEYCSDCYRTAMKQETNDG
jgi:hypothetical protein